MLVVCVQCHEVVQSGDSAQTCCVVWLVPENIETVVTLFRDPRRCEFEDKDWSFSIEVVVNKIFNMLTTIATPTRMSTSLIFLICVAAHDRSQFFVFYLPCHQVFRRCPVCLVPLTSVVFLAQSDLSF